MLIELKECFGNHILTLYPEKCKRLVKLARKYDLLIICDDVYNILNYKDDEKNPGAFQPSPPRLYSYDNKSDPDYKGSYQNSLVMVFKIACMVRGVTRKIAIFLT